jgi:predicted DNA-binding transcriptional regulator AlpA
VSRVRALALPAEGFVRLETVCAVMAISRHTWRRGVNAGTYPAPVKLGPRLTRWKVEDIRALIAAQAS